MRRKIIQDNSDCGRILLGDGHIKRKEDPVDNIKVLNILTVLVSLIVVGCATSKDILLTQGSLQERRLKYVVDERPDGEINPANLNIFSAISRVPLKQFKPSPVELLDEKIENKFGTVATENSVHLKHFEVLQVAEKSHGQAVAAAFAGLSYITAVLNDQEAQQKSDYVMCYVSGTINGQPFEVNEKEIYIRTPFKSAWNSKDFLDTLKDTTNYCVDLTIEKYAQILNVDIGNSRAVDNHRGTLHGAQLPEQHPIINSKQ
jgi:hypothetical protein